MNKINLTIGQKIKCFTFVKEVECRTTKKGAKIRYAEVICNICGNKLQRSIYSLTNSRNINSCGCLKAKLCGDNSRVHGESKTRLYKIWSGIKDRCGKRNNYNHVSFSEDWDKYIDFKYWALSNGYKDNLTIDRINVYGDYTPGNCRWVDMNVQCANKRRINSRNTSGFLGVTFEKKTGKWISQIEYNVDGKRNCKKIGRFDDAINGAYARDKFIIEHDLPHTLNFERIKI